jgi:outer membrane cobalamin receptor
MKRLLFLTSTILSSVIYASDVDPFDLSLEEILSVKVEVATLSSDDERDIPAAVSVMTEKEWSRFGAIRGSDVIDRMTGMSTSPFIGSYVAGLRGFNSSSSFRKMAYVLDGIPLNTFYNGSSQIGVGNFPDLFMLERIEVARGPISNIYGSSAMLGAVSMKTWNPSKDKVEAKLSKGSFGHDSFGIRLSKRINDKVKLSLLASQSDVDDVKGDSRYKDSSGVIRKKEYKNAWYKKSAMMKLDYSSFSFQLLHSTFSFFDQPVFELTSAYDPRSYSDQPYEFTMLKLEKRAAFAGYDLKTVLYGKLSTGSFSTTTVGEGLPDGSESVGLNKTREESFGLDLHLSPKTKQWFVGLDYIGSQVPYRRGSLGTIGSVISPIGGEGAKRYQLSVKGNYKLSLKEDMLALHIGGRYDSYSDDGERLSPRAGLIYKKSKELTYKLVYSNAYRVPDLGVKAGSSSFFVLPADKLDPEKFESIELIALYKNSHFKAFFSLFRNELKDEIVTVSQTPPNSKAINSRDGLGQGIETELKYSDKNWLYDLNATYTFSRDVGIFPKAIVKWSIGKQMNKVFASLYGKHYFSYLSSATPIPAGRYSVRNMSRYLKLGAHIDYSFKRFHGSHLVSLDIQNLLNRANVAPYNASRENGLIEEGIGFLGSYKFKF